MGEGGCGFRWSEFDLLVVVPIFWAEKMCADVVLLLLLLLLLLISGSYDVGII